MLVILWGLVACSRKLSELEFAAYSRAIQICDTRARERRLIQTPYNSLHPGSNLFATDRHR
jgi:hypothetical protein